MSYEKELTAAEVKAKAKKQDISEIIDDYDPPLAGDYIFVMEESSSLSSL